VWSVVNSPNPSSRANYLNGIAASTTNDVWAVGGYAIDLSRGATLIEHWDGSQWSVVLSPNPASSINQLIGVTAIAANDVWAVGYFQSGGPWQPLIEHWDGGQWSIVPSPYIEGGGALYSVSAVSANDVWAVGYYINSSALNQTLIEHWDGTQWSIVPSPNIGLGDNWLWGVSALSANDVWAVGEYDEIGGGNRTLILRWNGAQWSIVPSPNCPTSREDRLRGVVAVSNNDVWAVGGCLGAETLIQHWDGSQWSIVPSPNPGDFQMLYAVSAVSPNDVWAVGYYFYENGINSTLILHWDGTNWSQVPSPNPGTFINHLEGVAAISANDVWAAGSFKNGGGPWQTLVEHYAPPSGQCTSPTPSSTPSATPWPSLSPTIVPSATHTPTAVHTAFATVTATFIPEPTETTAITHSPTATAPATTPTAIVTSTSTACSIGFTDVLPDSTFYAFVHCLACKGIISGYPCGGVGEPCGPDNSPYFRPNNYVTRGQLAKIVSESAGFDEDVPPSQWTFTDVPYGSTFWVWVERLAGREVMSGYTCGIDPGEPCDSERRPYFRPGNGATRGQLTKIVSNAAGFSDTIPETQYTFADVPPTHTFWVYVERLLLNRPNVMGGYQCGGPGEPCDSENRAYFRPNNPLTRGQTSKIVSNTFFPGCSPPQH
jgi:hypothetical protein